MSEVVSEQCSANTMFNGQAPLNTALDMCAQQFLADGRVQRDTEHIALAHGEQKFNGLQY